MATEGSGSGRPTASVAVPGETRLSASISYILRIGKALLWGFIKTLWERCAASSHPSASLEQFERDNMAEEQANGEDEPDAARVSSLQAHMFRILQELRNIAEISRLAESVKNSERPLCALAEISEEMFATGANWGRIVVFFYFTFEVGRQSATGFFQHVMAWAFDFLRDRLAHWIEQHGGWNGLLNFFPSSSEQNSGAIGISHSG